MHLAQNTRNNEASASLQLTWAVSSSPPGACVHWPLWAAAPRSCLCPDTDPRGGAGSSHWTCRMWPEGRASILGGTRRGILRRGGGRRSIIKEREMLRELLCSLRATKGERYKLIQSNAISFWSVKRDPQASRNLKTGMQKNSSCTIKKLESVILETESWDLFCSGWFHFWLRKMQHYSKVRENNERKAAGASPWFHTSYNHLSARLFLFIQNT